MVSINCFSQTESDSVLIPRSELNEVFNAIDTLMEMVTGIKHEKDITYLAKRSKYGIDNLIGFNANCIKWKNF